MCFMSHASSIDVDCFKGSRNPSNLNTLGSIQLKGQLCYIADFGVELHGSVAGN